MHDPTAHDPTAHDPTAHDPTAHDPTALGATAHVNEVHLVGRLAAEAQQRELPSGDRIVTFRLVVERSAAQRRQAGRQGGQALDALECTAWGAAQRRAALRWIPGDVVSVDGRLRRRFQRTDGPTVSHYGVEVVSATRLARAGEPAVPAGAHGG